MKLQHHFDPSCFKAYDIRGRVSDQLSAKVCKAIGAATVNHANAKLLVIGRDVRADSPEFSSAFVEGARSMGANVIDIGLCGAEEVYFHTVHFGADVGAVITASHNPIEYNGIKLVKKGSYPYSCENGLFEIRDLTAFYLEQGNPTSKCLGTYKLMEDKSKYIDKLLTFVNIEELKPLKIVCNAGNGTAGLVLDLLEPHLPFELIKINNEPNSAYPNGVPNPMLAERREQTSNAVLAHGADLGLAWDGDFDRCFFFDSKGAYVDAYYIIGILTEVLLKRGSEQTIAYDPRSTWNTLARVQELGGNSIETRIGPSFFKDAMREHQAVYGGETAAHHYFKDFYYCDTGMVPWLLVAQAMSQETKSLSNLVGSMAEEFPCSGEINFKVQDAFQVMERLKDWGQIAGGILTQIDGYSLEFREWRFNVRRSNTEALLRLNVETRADKKLLAEKITLLRSIILADDFKPIA